MSMVIIVHEYLISLELSIDHVSTNTFTVHDIWYAIENYMQRNNDDYIYVQNMELQQNICIG